MTDNAGTRRTILIVEDEPDIRQMLVVALEGAGYRVVQASNGRQAIIAAKVPPKDERPDCILMDLNLPHVDGLDAIRLIRQSAPMPLCNVPIVVLSGLDSSIWREKALAAGCNEFLSKPIEPKDLIEVVKRYTDKPAA